MKIAVIGTGYVGLVTGVVLADLGNDVIFVDIDPKKLSTLRSGKVPFFEPGLEEILSRCVEDGFISFTDSAADAAKASEIIFIAVGTPPAEDGSPDLSAIKAVAHALAPAIGDGYKVIVNKSTVPVGSSDLVSGIIASHGVPDSAYDVVSNPEFLREGSAIRDTMEPDRIVVGATNPVAAQKLIDLYSPLSGQRLVTDPKSAELIKYASNSFLAAKISYINAISRLCEICGADIRDVAAGVGSDSRIGGQFLQAGLGWGGSCFPKDVLGLLSTSKQLGYDFGFLKAVVDINDDQIAHFISKIETRLGGFEGKAIGLMGMAFKPNTDDIRDARSELVIKHVEAKGGKVRGYDPAAAENIQAAYPNVEIVDSVYELGDGVDALVLVTEWNEFRQIDLKRLTEKMNQKVLFDGRNVYQRAVVEEAGIEYFGIGT